MSSVRVGFALVLFAMVGWYLRGFSCGRGAGCFIFVGVGVICSFVLCDVGLWWGVGVCCLVLVF